MDNQTTPTTHIEVSSSPSKNIVFDIVGTLISYDNFYQAVETRIGARLRAHGVHPLGFANAWMESAERECTFQEISGSYVPFLKIFGPLFYRTLMFQGIANARDVFTDDEAADLVDAYRNLKAREGVNECFEVLREGGFEVWALTSGDRERVTGYIADNGLNLAVGNVFFCEVLGAGKPYPIVYQHYLKKFEGQGEVWFAAAHMWDSAAAKRNGYVRFLSLFKLCGVM